MIYRAKISDGCNEVGSSEREENNKEEMCILNISQRYWCWFYCL